MRTFIIEPCSGVKGCPNSVVKISSLVDEIEKIAKREDIEGFIKNKVKGIIRQHNCFRVGIANCPNSCSQVHIKDFGVVGKVKIAINNAQCTLCGSCVNTCFERALKIENNKLIFDLNRCIGCGMCVKKCEAGAITIKDRGFQILIGGKLGRHPMLAFVLENFANEKEVAETFKKVINFYKKNSFFGERLGTILQRMKILNKEDFKKFL